MASDETIRPSGGMVLHAKADWPCARCRPSSAAEGGEGFLCVECAAQLVGASFEWLDGRGDNSEALSDDADPRETTPEITWQLFNYGLLDADDR